MNSISNSYLKRFTICTVLMMFLLLITSFNALAKAPENVREAALNSVVEQFKEVLNNERDHYGLTSSDDINTLTLGEGIPYKQFDINNINSSSSSFKSVIKKSDEVKYIFPMKVNNKPCGIAFIEKINGKWQALKISSDLTFERDFNDAKNMMINKTENANSNEELTLIYDAPTGVSGLYSDKNDSIVMMDDSVLLDTQKNDIKKFSDVKKNMVQLHEKSQLSSEQEIGGQPSNESVKPSYTPYLIGVGVIGVGIVAVFLIRRKLTHK